MQSKVTNTIKNITRGTTAAHPITEDAIIAEVMSILKTSYIEAKVEFEIALDDLLEAELLMSTVHDCKETVTMLSGKQKRYIPCLYRA